MARGDHIRARRRGYWHHGIDCGDGTVIHYDGELKDRAHAAVTRTSMAAFAKGSRVEVVQPINNPDPDRVLRRAESRLGETRYGAIRNNCEHFARWCRDGSAKSQQVRQFLFGAGVAVVAGTVLLVGGAVLLVRRAGLGRA